MKHCGCEMAVTWPDHLIVVSVNFTLQWSTVAIKWLWHGQTIWLLFVLIYTAAKHCVWEATVTGVARPSYCCLCSFTLQWNTVVGKQLWHAWPDHPIVVCVNLHCSEALWPWSDCDMAWPSDLNTQLLWPCYTHQKLCSSVPAPCFDSRPEREICMLMVLRN